MSDSTKTVITLTKQQIVEIAAYYYGECPETLKREFTTPIDWNSSDTIEISGIIREVSVHE